MGTLGRSGQGGCQRMGTLGRSGQGGCQRMGTLGNVLTCRLGRIGRVMSDCLRAVQRVIVFKLSPAPDESQILPAVSVSFRSQQALG